MNIPTVNLAEIKGQIANIEEVQKRWLEQKQVAVDNLLRLEGALNSLKAMAENLESRINAHFTELRNDLPKHWVFPSDVNGWLTEEEGRELAKLATDKTVLEIGSYCGLSTICMAQVAKHVHAVDTFDGRGTPNPRETLEEFKKNMRDYRVANAITVYRCPSMFVEVPDEVDMAFIDGAHDAESVKTDIEVAKKYLKPSGFIVFHDYCDFHKEVVEVVNEFGEVSGQCGSLAVVKLYEVKV